MTSAISIGGRLVCSAHFAPGYASARCWRLSIPSYCAHVPPHVGDCCSILGDDLVGARILLIQADHFYHSRHENHRNLRTLLAQCLNDFGADHSGHSVIRHNEMELVGGKEVERV